MSAHRLADRLARPPRVLSAVALVWVLSLISMYSDAGVGILGFFLLFYGGLALLLAWLLRGAAYLAVRRGGSTAGLPSVKWWAVVPGCIATALTLATFFESPTNPLFQARFRLSEAALTRRAQSLLAASGTDVRDRGRVGLFVADRIEVHDGQVRFITTSCGVVDACGLVYVPSGEPRSVMEDRFTHLRGPWWHLYEGF